MNNRYIMIYTILDTICLMLPKTSKSLHLIQAHAAFLEIMSEVEHPFRVIRK